MKVKKSKKSKSSDDSSKKSSNRKVNIKIEKLSTLEFTLNYVLKYISANKDEFMTTKDFAKFISVSRKKKLIIPFGKIFYKNKLIKKQQPLCPCCNNPLEYIFDMQLLNWIERRLEESQDPPPLDLRDYLDYEV